MQQGAGAVTAVGMSMVISVAGETVCRLHSLETFPQLTVSLLEIRGGVYLFWVQEISCAVKEGV